MKELLFFTAQWSTPADLMRPMLRKLAAEYRLPCRERAVDSEPGLVKAYGLTNLPMLLLVDGREELKRWAGFRAEADLRLGLDQDLGRIPTAPLPNHAPPKSGVKDPRSRG